MEIEKQQQTTISSLFFPRFFIYIAPQSNFPLSIFLRQIRFCYFGFAVKAEVGLLTKNGQFLGKCDFYYAWKRLRPTIHLCFILLNFNDPKSRVRVGRDSGAQG